MSLSSKARAEADWPLLRPTGPAQLASWFLRRCPIPLSQKKCVPCEGGISALGLEQVDELAAKTPLWTVGRLRDDGPQCISRSWRTRGFLKGLELFRRVGEVAEETGHHPDLHLVSYNNVTVQLSTHAASGLTENDFIVAVR